MKGTSIMATELLEEQNKDYWPFGTCSAKRSAQCPVQYLHQIYIHTYIWWCKELKC